MEALRRRLENALKEYNEYNPTMNLVLFPDVIRHVCRIARAVSSSAGHALLVGLGGSGKASLSRLAAYLCDQSLYRINVSPTYSLLDFKDDVKTMYTKTGVKDEGVMFLLRDSDILQERYLVYVNDMLGSGDIPDLFTEEEKEAIIGSIMGKVKALGLPQDQKSCWNFFIEQVRKNLHIVVCMSPASEDFRKRCTRFPALVTCTVIDWFQPWPADALLSVAQRFLSLAEDLGTENVREAILRFMPFAFEAAGRAAKDFLAVEGRRVYNTNKTYLECLKLFNRLLKDRRSEVQEGINRLRNGLQQLKSASEE
ncbi:ODA11, partial [Symbiodinium sp. KB8]